MIPENPTLDDISQMVTQLTDVIGPTLLGIACGTPNSQTVLRWALGQEQPDEDELKRLMMVEEVIGVVHDSVESGIARMWFAGRGHITNEELSPMQAIRVCNFDDARASAQRMAGAR